ncbi:hypothetical protein GCM10010289_50970 [Streptomyces violascens]|uniref:Uncharacterized protein n=1 Tax=Streptomyces violascens TaxID=67381 RepID=A0ABQ3QQ74_9ACTN|nr:hypothetical protein GCM10010289_50970 [Streptomyces violascens]GHI39433.1 hypothetical protein Sviol_38410 [Streptomyces violascens]
MRSGPVIPKGRQSLATLMADLMEEGGSARSVPPAGLIPVCPGRGSPRPSGPWAGAVRAPGGVCGPPGPGYQSLCEEDEEDMNLRTR